MAAKQILSLVVASTWVVNLLIDNQIKEPKAYAAYRTKSVCENPYNTRYLLVL